MEIYGCVFDTMVGQFVLDALHYVTLDVKLVVVREAIDFVDEDFDVDVWVGWLEVQDGAIEPVDSFKVFILCVDNPNQGTNFTEDGVEIEGWVHEINLAREVPDLEVHKGARMISRSQRLLK